MKLKIFAALGLSLALLLSGCATPASTQIAPAVSGSTTTLPAKDERPVYSEDTTTAPEPEAPQAPEAAEEAPAQELSIACSAQTLTGSFDEVCTYTLELPSFSGLATADADSAVNAFYEKLGANLETYAYETVYHTAQERRTGADMQGAFAVSQADAEALIVEYTVTVSYGGEEERHARTDTFDPATGELLDSAADE